MNIHEFEKLYNKLDPKFKCNPPTIEEIILSLKEERDKYWRRNNYLRKELKALHKRLQDSNRGAERLHLMNAQLRIELVEYKIKHPETTV